MRKWKQQPTQRLAIGGFMRQWVRLDSRNGWITKVPHKDYEARWASGEGKEMEMHCELCPTLKVAKTTIEQATIENK